MKPREIIEIGPKKFPVWSNYLIILYSIAMSTASIYILFHKETVNNPKTVYDIVLGSLGLFLFGLIPNLILWFKKGTKALLTITNEGYHDHVSGEFITWGEIRTIQLKKNWLYSKYIAIQLHDSIKFMNSPRKLKRLIEQINYKMTGAQIFITSINMEIQLEHLFAILQEKKESFENEAIHSGRALI
jgi:hypothetical protein